MKITKRANKPLFSHHRDLRADRDKDKTNAPTDHPLFYISYLPYRQLTLLRWSRWSSSNSNICCIFFIPKLIKNRLQLTDQQAQEHYGTFTSASTSHRTSAASLLHFSCRAFWMTQQMWAAQDGNHFADSDHFIQFSSKIRSHWRCSFSPERGGLITCSNTLEQ